MKIFFDVDGVIMDNIHMRKGWIKRWDADIKKDLGIDPDKFQEIFKEWFPAAQLGQASFEKEMERWLRWNDYDVKAWQIINYWNEKDTNVNPGVYGAIRAISASNRADLFVATNQTHERARYLWDVFGFKNHFRDIFYSARMGCFKSDDAFFAGIERELKIDAENDPPLYFDDDVRNIEVARARGWNAVLVDGPGDVTGHPKIQELVSA